MEISNELIEKYGLTEDAVNDIKTVYTNTINDILPKKELEYDTKYKEKYSSLANENGEKLATSIADSVANEFGFEKRQKGEKLKDYYTRIETDYKDRLKSVNGDKDGFVSIEKEKHDDWLKKLANYDELSTKAQEYETLKEKNERLAKENAFTNVKPAFSKDANPFEVKAKWEMFEKEIDEKYIVKNDNGVYKAIDRENEFNVKLLKDLVENNESLKSITAVRSQNGLGTQADTGSIQGLPFKISKNASKTEISAAINAHLDSKNIPSHKRNDEFLKLWGEVNKK